MSDHTSAILASKLITAADVTDRCSGALKTIHLHDGQQGEGSTLQVGRETREIYRPICRNVVVESIDDNRLEHFLRKQGVVGLDRVRYHSAPGVPWVVHAQEVSSFHLNGIAEDQSVDAYRSRRDCDTMFEDEFVLAELTPDGYEGLAVR